MFVQSFTVDVCFPLRLLKKERFSVLTLNLRFRHVPTCYLNISVMWKLEASL